MQSPPNAENARETVLLAALPHVPFDGWSETTLRAAIADSGVAEGLARACFPAAASTFAVAFPQGRRRAMREALAMDRPVADALPRPRGPCHPHPSGTGGGPRTRPPGHHALCPAPARRRRGKADLGTADAIWTALGDTTRDLNWYSKRATLSAVYGSTVLYWLGDDTPGHQATWDFLDRRISDVMQIETLKAKLRENPLGKAILAGPAKVMEKWRVPTVPDDLPGKIMDRFRQG